MILLFPGSQGEGKKDKSMKNSTFKENVRKQLEVNEKIHAMGLDVWYDGNFKHVRIYKTYKNEYNQDNIKFIGYIDDDFNIVINE